MADYNPNQFTPEVGEAQRIARGEPSAKTGASYPFPRPQGRRITPDVKPEPPTRRCPTGGAVIIKGEWFPCDFMDQMSEDSETHEGWPHGNSKAQAIWQ